MFNFFDYLFYRTCEFYKKGEEGSGYEFSGVLVVSAMYGFNILSILLLIGLIINRKVAITEFHSIVLPLVLVAFNVIRYNLYDYEMFKKKWEIEEDGKKKIKTNWIVGYIILSTILFFGLAIYTGSKKNWN